jgi:hypothetical protein
MEAALLEAMHTGDWSIYRKEISVSTLTFLAVLLFTPTIKVRNN